MGDISIAQMDQVARSSSDDGFRPDHRPRRGISSTLLECSADYPSQHYFVTTSPAIRGAPHIMFVIGIFWPAYGAGILAALISDKKQAVGLSEAMTIPNQQRIKRAFIAGAQHVVPGIRALAIITGDYDNAAKGREGRLD